MARQFPEKVSAKMVRIQDHDNNYYILRHTTQIHFGDADSLLGSVIMTNLGGFEFNHHPEWEAFKNGKSKSSTLESTGYPDLTMQNLIKMIRLGFMQAGLGKPQGVLRIHNISNVRQPNGNLVEKDHDMAIKIINRNQLLQVDVLEDPIAHRKEKFLQCCQESPFVILGFRADTFPDKVNQIIEWSKERNDNLVYALDSKGRFSHPRRWRTEPHLMESAVQRLVSVLQKKMR